MMEDSDLTVPARRLFSGRVEFLLSAPSLNFLPEPDHPEIAFAGRSNVGKSSLINAVTGRKAIARTSVTPGRTQELNFFEVGDPTRLRLVDMPGYGFAKAPIKIVDNWKKLVRTYLRGRAVLKRTLVLIDARHGIKPPDAEMMAMLDEAAVGYRLVLIPRRWSLFAIPMPKVLLPKGASFETEREGKFCFDVEIAMPLVGRIVAYRGTLQEGDSAGI